MNSHLNAVKLMLICVLAPHVQILTIINAITSKRHRTVSEEAAKTS